MNQEETKIDYSIILLVMCLCLIGIAAIYIASLTNNQYASNFLIRQLIWLGAGAGLIVIIMKYFDYDRLQYFAYYLYAAGLFLLVLVFAPVIGIERNGAHSWLGTQSINIQPSELMKSFLIVALAKLIWDNTKKQQVRTLKSDFILFIKIGLMALAPIALIMLQSDLGTALVLVSITVGMIFISGITWRLLLPIFGSIAVLGTSLVLLVIYNPAILTSLGFEKYQFNRITSWLQPEKDPLNTGMQLLYSIRAIGSGELTGSGIGYEAIQIPENHNDFIFTVIGGDFGFVGACALLVVYFLLVYQIIRVALDIGMPFYSYICMGVVSMIFFHVLQNIGMTIGMLPITGIPLLFISYGGSAMLGSLMAIGLVLSARYNAPRMAASLV
ncbi:FtsW/RodA/SpoVE family cell cycle protein [Listeria booriae]|uniref:FtsW/RodA/SpoVE family cell cycle protein n=1 Tax=Listeria booriae TaxID=1552123 RepID=UPI0016288030|nr:FtsW/RodA/SpoVE family cell cycle protein [Listeria booriae]MBC1271296.1 rod shape-determining protein RodA [Listeria booriae]